jgi:hypothetical protein
MQGNTTQLFIPQAIYWNNPPSIIDLPSVLIKEINSEKEKNFTLAKEIESEKKKIQELEFLISSCLMNKDLYIKNDLKTQSEQTLRSMILKCKQKKARKSCKSMFKLESAAK